MPFSWPTFVTMDLMRLKLFPFTLKDKAPQTLILKSSMLYKVLFGHYIPPKTMQITKMTKAVNYYRDNLGRKHKKEGQKVKRKKGQEILHCEILQPCEISQELRRYTGGKYKKKGSISNIDAEVLTIIYALYNF